MGFKHGDGRVDARAGVWAIQKGDKVEQFGHLGVGGPDGEKGFFDLVQGVGTGNFEKLFFKLAAKKTRKSGGLDEIDSSRKLLCNRYAWLNANLKNVLELNA